MILEKVADVRDFSDEEGYQAPRVNSMIISLDDFQPKWVQERISISEGFKEQDRIAEEEINVIVESEEEEEINDIVDDILDEQTPTKIDIFDKKCKQGQNKDTVVGQLAQKSV